MRASRIDNLNTTPDNVDVVITSNSGELRASGSLFLAGLGQQNCLKIFNTGNIDLRVDIDAYDLNGVFLGSSTQYLGPQHGADRELKFHLQLPLPNNSYRQIRLRSSLPNALISDLLRVKSASEGSFIDLAKGLPVR